MSITDHKHPDAEDQNHDLNFSRTGTVAPMGTLIDQIKTWIDPDTAAAFKQLAHDAGTDASGALRDWVYLKVHGKTYTDICLDAAKVKRDVLFGTGPIQALQVRDTGRPT